MIYTFLYYEFLTVFNQVYIRYHIRLVLKLVVVVYVLMDHLAFSCEDIKISSKK